jgi:GNAT superfamily N-acetyltransferase
VRARAARTRPDLALRRAAAADTEFVYRVVEATMRTYVEQTWGSFSEHLTRKGVGEMIVSGNCSIIEFEGADIGVLSVERLADHIKLDQLFILPSHQNRGIGTAILRTIAQEARQAGKPVRLRLLAVNPVRRLYEREGFRITSTTSERVYMELPNDLATLNQLNDGYIRSVARSDVRWFDEHLTDDFLNSNPDGTLVDRAGFLAQIARPLAVSDLGCEDVRIRVVGETAIIHARTVYRKPGGQAAAGRYTDIWQRRQGRWVCIAAHVTRG